jgi:tetratricopeptide (TPR) repeat protein
MEAMRLGQFRDAIKLFKQLVKEEGRYWLDGLAQAYAARARELAAKGKYEDAQILLENTAAQDGAVRDPLLYVHCLVKRGQHQKAAEHALKYVGTGKLTAAEAARLGEVAAALSLVTPRRLDAAGDPHSERGRWLEQAAAARLALAAWVEGKPHEEIDPLLSRISMRSDFKAVRLILKALITAPFDADRARQLMDPVAPQSPFAALRFAVEAALTTPQSDLLRSCPAASGPERSFFLQVNGLSESGCQSLAEFVKAENSGPSSLFAHLIKQTDKEPADDIRKACLSLLPRAPDRLSRFEKSFGPLSAFDKSRVLALAAEARRNWDAAERHWRAAAASLEGRDAPANLALGVIYRHLAHLAGAHDGIDVELDDTAADYLERSLRSDHNHLPTTLKLIAHYRAKHRLGDWDRLVEKALACFPDEAAVLLAAVEWAAHAEDLEGAIGHTHKLLLLDPINPAVRKRMIELRMLLARQKMRANRPDLAEQAIAEALKLELPEAPSSPLRIAAALIALGCAGSSAAVARLREAVHLAGGGVCAWVQASLEHLLMGSPGDGSVLRRELKAAQKAPPTKEAILSLAAAVDGNATREQGAAVASLVRGMRRWLLKGATLAWSADEVRPVVAMLRQAEAYQELGAYAKQGLARNQRGGMWHVYRLVAETKGNAGVLCEDDAEDLAAIADDAAQNDRLDDARLIWSFLDSADDRESANDTDTEADGYLEDLISNMIAASLAAISPEEVASLIAKHGGTKATKIVAGKLQKSTAGAILPANKLREFAQEMVETVMAEIAPLRAKEDQPWQQR